MKLVALIALFALMGSISPSWAEDAVFFSDRAKLVSPLLADPRDPQIKISFLRTERGTFFEPAFGADLGIYYKSLDASDGERRVISITVRGMVAPRFQFQSKSFDLWNTDFIGGPQLTYLWGKNALEFWPFHESSHEGPDISKRTHPDVNYSFEAVRLLYSRFLRPELRLYSGIESIVHADPSNLTGKISLRVGGEWHVLPLDPSLYLAADYEAKQVHAWTGNASVQVGYDLGAVDLQRRQRIFANFYHGYSPQGQFAEDRETAFSVGIGMTY